MIKNKTIKKNFSIFNYYKKIVYFDSANTGLKLSSVIKATNEYYEKYPFSDNSSNELSEKIFFKLERIRNKIANFLNAKREEIIFSYSTTYALNEVSHFFKNIISKDDEIILNYLEHASNVLP